MSMPRYFQLFEYINPFFHEMIIPNDRLELTDKALLFYMCRSTNPLSL